MHKSYLGSDLNTAQCFLWKEESEASYGQGYLIYSWRWSSFHSQQRDQAGWCPLLIINSLLSDTSDNPASIKPNIRPWPETHQEHQLFTSAFHVLIHVQFIFSNHWQGSFDFFKTVPNSFFFLSFFTGYVLISYLWGVTARAQAAQIAWRFVGNRSNM